MALPDGGKFDVQWLRHNDGTASDRQTDRNSSNIALCVLAHDDAR